MSGVHQRKCRAQRVRRLPAQASGQHLAAAGIGSRAYAFAACMWKTRIFAGFWRPIVKNTRFSSVFRGFSLAFSKSLGYSAQRPGFSERAKGRVTAWPHVTRGYRKNQADKNTNMAAHPYTKVTVGSLLQCN